MDLVCPKCRGPVKTEDGVTARCINHPGEFRILFHRAEPEPPALPAPPPEPSLQPSLEPTGGTRLRLVKSADEAEPPPMTFALTPGSVCAHHPAHPASYACAACGTPVCALCSFEDVDRGMICPACASRRSRAMAGPAIPAGMQCVQHPEVSATRQCRSCGGYMCETCCFQFPGGIQLCPACATVPQLAMSPRRRRMMWFSFALALWSTLATAVLFSGVLAEYVNTREGRTAVGLLVMFGDMVPAIVGFAVGLSAIDRRLSNPMWLWIAVIWNAVIGGGLVLLSIVGTMNR